MSCPAEEVQHQYVDGELGAEPTRELELHLISCERCRMLVLALREESALLGDVLREREPARARPAPAPEQGLAMGFPAALAGVTLAVVVAGALLELGAPRGLGWLNPLRLAGVGDMVFDLFFLVRAQAPGLVEFAAAIAATASVAALASIAVSALFRRVGGVSLVLLALLVPLAAAEARAVVIEMDEGYQLGVGERLAESLVVSGEVVRIEGVLQGDLIVAGAERVVVSGTVEGNVFAWARDIEINGKVTGSVYNAAQRVRVDGEVGRGAVLAGDRVTVGPEGRIQGDAVSFCESAVHEGRVGRDVVFVGDSLELRGSVDRNVDVRVARAVRVLDTAVVAGDLHAVIAEDEALELAPEATIGGEVTTARAEMHDHEWFSRFTDGHYYIWLLARLVAAFLFGLALFAVFPALFEHSLPTSQTFFQALGVGFLFLVATPLLLVVAGLTVVGLPLALFGVLVYATALYMAGIVVAALIGRQLMRGTADDTLVGFSQTLVVGLAIVLGAMQVPILGPPVRIVVVILGLGLLVSRLRTTLGSAGSARVGSRGRTGSP